MLVLHKSYIHSLKLQIVNCNELVMLTLGQIQNSSTRAYQNVDIDIAIVGHTVK